MNALTELFTLHSSAQAMLIMSLVISLGLFIGSLRIMGIQLGIAGVLFSGILFSAMGASIELPILELLRELGLVFFVYTIGVQLGPGFMNSFKKDGLRLNLMAAAIALLGFALALILRNVFNVEKPLLSGILSGATTNTPSLAAAQEALSQVADPERIKLSGVGYAAAYPFGILGVILTMLTLKVVFRVDVAAESRAREAETSPGGGMQVVNLEVQNPNLNGLSVRELPFLADSRVVISRSMHEGHVQVAHADTKVWVGDILVAVGPKEDLKDLHLLVGRVSQTDVRTLSKDITTRRIVVTKKEVVGKTLRELGLREKYDVTFTRLIRNEVEIPVTASLAVAFGDVLFAVGEEAELKQAAKELGNAPSQLNDPQLIPVFLGIFLGVVLVMTPIHLPGVAVPVKLGLAGGPLIVALILSRIGHVGRLVWYMPVSANFMMRELGISLFLACVGLKSGPAFVQALTGGQGLLMIALGAAITVIPLAAVAFFCRIRYKMNYVTLCGLMAGSMTDPPALAFAGKFTSSKAAGISYASVYPVAMILRIVLAQLLVLF